MLALGTKKYLSNIMLLLDDPKHAELSKDPIRIVLVRIPRVGLGGSKVRLVLQTRIPVHQISLSGRGVFGNGERQLAVEGYL